MIKRLSVPSGVHSNNLLSPSLQTFCLCPHFHTLTEPVSCSVSGSGAQLGQAPPQPAGVRLLRVWTWPALKVFLGEKKNTHIPLSVKQWSIVSAGPASKQTWNYSISVCHMSSGAVRRRRRRRKGEKDSVVEHVIAEWPVMVRHNCRPHQIERNCQQDKVKDFLNKTLEKERNNTDHINKWGAGFQMWRQREGRRIKRGRDSKRRARWRNCHGSRKKAHSCHSEGVFTFPGAVAQNGKGGLEKVRGCRTRRRVVSGPLPRALLGVWFHVSLGNDSLMEKLGALKMRKENKNINGSRLVPFTNKTQLVRVTAANIAAYSWVNNYHVILWSWPLLTRTPIHI